MDESSALIAVSEIAVAVAGFSGVATALGHRTDAEFWADARRARLIDLLCHSGIALFASLVPLVWLYRLGSTPRLWLGASLIWACFGTLGTIYGLMRNSQAVWASRFERMLGWLIVGMFALLVVLQLRNVFALHAFWPYLGALVGNLAFAFIQFMRLVIPPRSEPDQGEPGSD